MKPAQYSRQKCCVSKLGVDSKMGTHCAALLNASFVASLDAGLQQVKSFALLADAGVQVLKGYAVFQGTGLDKVSRRDTLVGHDQASTETQGNFGVVWEKVVST